MQPLALAKLSERNPERVAQQGEVEDLSLFCCKNKVLFNCVIILNYYSNYKNMQRRRKKL